MPDTINTNIIINDELIDYIKEKNPTVLKVGGIVVDSKGKWKKLLARFNQALINSNVTILHFKNIGAELIRQIQLPVNLSKIVIEFSNLPESYKQQTLDALFSMLSAYDHTENLEPDFLNDADRKYFQTLRTKKNELPLEKTANSNNASQQSNSLLPFPLCDFLTAPTGSSYDPRFFTRPASISLSQTYSNREQSENTQYLFAGLNPGSAQSAAAKETFASQKRRQDTPFPLQPGKIPRANFPTIKKTWQQRRPVSKVQLPGFEKIVILPASEPNNNHSYLTQLIKRLEAEPISYLLIEDVKTDTAYLAGMKRLIINFNAALQKKLSLEVIELRGNSDMAFTETLTIPSHIKSIMISNVDFPEVIERLSKKITHVTHLTLTKIKKAALDKLALPPGLKTLELVTLNMEEVKTLLPFFSKTPLLGQIKIENLAEEVLIYLLTKVQSPVEITIKMRTEKFYEDLYLLQCAYLFVGSQRQGYSTPLINTSLDNLTASQKQIVHAFQYPLAPLRQNSPPLATQTITSALDPGGTLPGFFSICPEKERFPDTSQTQSTEPVQPAAGSDADISMIEINSIWKSVPK